MIRGGGEGDSNHTQDMSTVSSEIVAKIPSGVDTIGAASTGGCWSHGRAKQGHFLQYHKGGCRPSPK